MNESVLVRKKPDRCLCLLQVALTARNELLESIRRYPGEEGADDNNFRKTMNSIQKRVIELLL